MTRVTLRLPDHLHQRLVERSRREHISLNQAIVARLAGAMDAPVSQEVDERALYAAALGDLMLSPEEIEVLAPIDESVPLLTHEELQRRLPSLPDEKSLSRAIIEDREDRL